MSKKIEEKKAVEKQLVDNVKADEPKRFQLNIGDESKPDDMFTFSWPRSAPLGMIYDAAYTVVNYIFESIKKRTEAIKPKTEEDIKGVEAETKESK